MARNIAERMRSVPKNAVELEEAPGYYITKDGRIFSGAMELHPYHRGDGMIGAPIRINGRTRILYVGTLMKKYFGKEGK